VGGKAGNAQRPRLEASIHHHASGWRRLLLLARLHGVVLHDYRARLIHELDHVPPVATLPATFDEFGDELEHVESSIVM
jgi:hypothetical protein